MLSVIIDKCENFIQPKRVTIINYSFFNDGYPCDKENLFYLDMVILWTISIGRLDFLCINPYHSIIEKNIMLMDDRQTDNGSVRINNEVVAIIAGIAANEVEGVAGMGGGFSLTEVLGKKSMTKGVKVEIALGEAAIDLYVVVEYGRNIPEVASLVQQNVKRQVEAMTGLSVVEVNVNVEGVQVRKDRRHPSEATSMPEYQVKNYR